MKNVMNLKHMMLFVAMLFLVNFASAQAKGPNKARQEQLQQQKDELKAKLKLTPEQSAKIDEITKRNKEEAKIALDALPPTADKRERDALKRAYLRSADTEILAILDTEQQKIYKEEKEKMKAQMQEKKKAGKGNFTAQ